MAVRNRFAARAGCWTAAFILIAWAVSGSAFRDAEGSLAGLVCLPVAGAFALLVLGAGVGTRYEAFACWVSVAMIGQAVSLQMIDAGRRLHYQHYEPLAVVWRARPWLLAWVAVQSLLVGIAFSSRLRTWIANTRVAIGPWQLLAVAVLSCSTAATVSPSVPRYLSELAFAVYLQLLGVATIVVAAFAFPSEKLDALQRAVDGVRPSRMAWCAALSVTLVAALLNVVSYQRHPHVEDEVADLMQARYMAKGMLSMPAPPVPEAFDVEQMYFEPGRWWAPIPPGWPAALAVGIRAGVPWLVNPILGGVNVLLAFLVLRRLYDERTAGLAAALLALSPWYVFLAMSFMTHALTLTFALIAVIGVMQSRETRQTGWALLAGAAIGALVLVRPLDAVIVAGVLGLWSLGAGGSRLRWASIAALGVGTVAVGGLTLPYNAHLTGDPWVFPINAFFDKYWGPHTNAYGFGPDRGAGWPIDPNPGHGPVDALINANLNTFSINTDLFGWSTGSLILVALLLCAGSIGRTDRLMIAAMAAVFVAHFFYYFSGGPDFGARYWFLMIVPLVALTVRGIDWLARGAGARVALAVLVLCAIALVNYFPWRAVDKYYRYLNMRPDIRELARRHGFDGGLVLIRGKRGPDYASAAIQNPVDLTAAAPIYVWDRNADVRAAVLRAFPNRPVWIVDGPTVTNSRYRVVMGPLPAAAVMAQSWSPPGDFQR